MLLGLLGCFAGANSVLDTLLQALRNVRQIVKFFSMFLNQIIHQKSNIDLLFGAGNLHKGTLRAPECHEAPCAFVYNFGVLIYEIENNLGHLLRWVFMLENVFI